MTQSISLRRAAKLRNRLEIRLQEVRALVAQTSANFNVYDPNITDQMDAKRKTYAESFARFNAISASLFGIRARLGSANTAAGLSDLLAEQSALLGQQATNLPLTVIEVSPTNEQISARVAGAVERLKVATRGYGLDDQISFSFITQEMIDQAKKLDQQLRVRLDQIQDKLENINSSQKIDLTDVDVEVLTAERLM